ncbi:hypothetical protein [Nostoc sp.]|uniref:hypothetical protein n=1 Tax=Nostoc sp. TaxID=1180 RepID=UPI002FFBFBAD
MNKDKLTNDTTSGKTQLNPISGSDGFDGSDNPPPKGDSCSENTPSSPTGSANPPYKGDSSSPSIPGSDNSPPKGKANSGSAPIVSDNPSPKPQPSSSIRKPSKTEGGDSDNPSSKGVGSNSPSNPGGSNHTGGKGK